jgi:hypothetical protein
MFATKSIRPGTVVESVGVPARSGGGRTPAAIAQTDVLSVRRAAPWIAKWRSRIGSSATGSPVGSTIRPRTSRPGARSMTTVSSISSTRGATSGWATSTRFFGIERKPGMKHSISRYTPDGPELSYDEVRFTKYEPMERTY